LVKYWSYTGQILVIYWSNLGSRRPWRSVRSLVKNKGDKRSDSGHKLVKHWSYTGQILVSRRPWRSVRSPAKPCRNNVFVLTLVLTSWPKVTTKRHVERQRRNGNGEFLFPAGREGTRRAQGRAARVEIGPFRNPAKRNGFQVKPGRVKPSSVKSVSVKHWSSTGQAGQTRSDTGPKNGRAGKRQTPSLSHLCEELVKWSRAGQTVKSWSNGQELVKRSRTGQTVKSWSNAKC
jgi:hypothetical protein